MKRHFSGTLSILTALVLGSVFPLHGATSARPDLRTGDGSLRFEQNQGQTARSVRYLARSRGQIIFIRKDGISLKLASGAQSVPVERVDIDFVGAADAPAISGQNLLSGMTNIFRVQGNSIHVPAFGEVMIGELWRKTSVLVYAREGRLEYDFRLLPGADPSMIRLGIRGAQSWKIREDGDVEVVTPQGHRILQHAPEVYQLCEGRRIPLDASYFRSENGNLGLSVPGFDSERELIIDPVLTWATYYGGSDVDSAEAIAVDAQGNSYFCGDTLSTDFPLEAPFQDSISQTDAFVVKMDPSGALVWSSYLGGHSNDHAEAIEVDSSGNVYVAGWTFSSDFPLEGAAQPSSGGSSDAFITKMPPTGDRLIYSSFFGGSRREECYGLSVDSSGRASICGNTESSDLPTHGAFQNSHGGSRLDAFIARFTAGGSGISFATYLGGDKDETAHAIANGDDASLYIAGDTASTDFPVHNAYQGSKPGGYGTAAFVTKLNPNGGISYSTYLGGSSSDWAYGIDVDSSGMAVVCGKTSSLDFPVVSPYQEEKAGAEDAFITRLTSQGSSLDSSSYLGGSDHDWCEDLQIGADGSWYLVGSTQSNDFPLAGADQSAFGGERDAVVTILDPDSKTLKYSSYFGGSGSDEGFGISLDGGGNLYIAGQSQSSDLPLLDAWQNSLSGSQDAFVLRVEGGGTPVAHSYVLGPVAHAPGANNSNWRSDLSIVCPEAAEATVVMTFSSASQTKTENLSIGPGNTLQWKDVLVSLFGYASTASVSGSIVISSSEEIEIISRTYNESSDGTFGQFIPGLSAGSGVTPSRSGIIAGIVQNTAFRTNLGAVNLGSGSVQLAITLFDTHGHQLGTEKDLTLQAHQWKQLSNILDAVGAGDSDLAWAKIEMVTAGGEAWAYASVVDNTSNDPTTIPVSLR